MKISKVTIIILGVLVLAVGFGVLYMMYAKQLQEQDTLKSQQTANQASVARLITEQQKYQAQLVDLQAQLDKKNQDVATAAASLSAAKAGWVADAPTIDYEEKLFALADSWNLAVSVTTGDDAVEQKIESVGFKTTNFTVTLTGLDATSGFDDISKYQDYIYSTVGDMLSYLDALTRDDSFKSAKIEMVSLTIPETPAKEDLVNNGTTLEQPISTFSVNVYTYTGG
jgi:hypothetical protein